MLLVWPPTNQTSLATNQVVIACEKLLQKVESISTFCNKSVNVAQARVI